MTAWGRRALCSEPQRERSREQRMSRDGVGFKASRGWGGGAWDLRERGTGWL